MYLQNLQINGFKSFAKKSELTFPSPITAIVGPNGSGKSNVAEALRFVLGEQSVKSMRGKRGEDLIWGGSEQTSRSNRASVSVTLNNEKRTLPLDTDIITVTRVVHRDGQNEYLLNNKNVRLKDVHELLAAGNIGPSGHHIISQGEADRVLSATPTERRNMIEEALGLKVYQYKKSDAEKKLAKTQQNLHEIHALRKEIAPHLVYLQRELDKQAEANALRKSLQDAYAEYLKREDHYLAAQSDRVTKELTVLQEQIDDTTGAIVAHEASAEKQSTHESDTVAEEKLQAEWQSARQKRDSVAQQLSAVQARHGAVVEQYEALQKSSQTEVVISEEALQEVVDAVQADAATADETTQVSTLQKIVQRITDRLQSFMDTLRDDKGSVDRLTALEKQQQALQADIDELETQLQQTTDVEQLARDAVSTYRAEQQDAMQAKQAATKELYEQKTKLAELRAQEGRLRHEQELMERERQMFKDELQEAVALLGRDAAQYFNQVVYDDDGHEVVAEAMVEEPREKQRERKRKLEKQKVRLETLGEGVADDVEKEYNDTKERDDFLAREIDDLESSVATLRELIDDLNEQIEDQFRAGFGQINKEFQNFFALMFGGGTATLEEASLRGVAETEDDDIEAESVVVQNGVDLRLQLPNKRIQGLAMLSGGERALTSIALIFAMSQVHPPLFVVLDETDAALDEANSRRYGDLIEALAARSQLLLITHNRETMSRAGVLYGVTMAENGVSKLLSVQLDQAVQNAK